MLELTMILKIKRKNTANAFKGTKLSIALDPVSTMQKTGRYGICQKFYTAGFSGQNFTLKMH